MTTSFRQIINRAVKEKRILVVPGAHDALSAPNVITCPECGESTVMHRACPHCGSYRGRKVIEVEAE